MTTPIVWKGDDSPRDHVRKQLRGYLMIRKLLRLYHQGRQVGVLGIGFEYSPFLFYQLLA